MTDWSIAVERFVDSQQSIHTRRAYRSDLLAFVGWLHDEGPKDGTPTKACIEEYGRQLALTGLKRSTVARKLAAIRSWIAVLFEEGLVSSPVGGGIDIGRLTGTLEGVSVSRPLSRADVSRLLAAASAHAEAGVRDHALITFLVHVPLRRDDTARMDVEHIKPRQAGPVVVIPCSDGTFPREYRLPDHVVDTLNRMCAHYDISTGPLWRSLSNRSRGKRLSANAIYEIVRVTAQHAGLPDIGAHTLRHTGCTLAIEAGASLQQVQSHARHKKIETTMVYIHQRDRLRESAADFIRVNSPSEAGGEE